MLSLFAVGALSGTLLGLRYKVLALLPAILVASLLILLGNTVTGGGFYKILSDSLILTVALQIGYACGLGLQLMVVLIRAGRLRRVTSVPSSTSITTSL